MQGLDNAAKHLDKSKKALREMPERQRAALLAGQGYDLRERLLEMRGRIDELLSGLSEDVDTPEVEDMPENFSGIPPEDLSRWADDGGQADASARRGGRSFP